MNGDPQKRKVLYEALTKDGYALGTLDEFSSKMDDPNKAKALYDGITKDGYEVGDFETFNAKVGSPKPAALSSMTTPLSGAAAGPSTSSVTPSAPLPTSSQAAVMQFDAALQQPMPADFSQRGTDPLASHPSTPEIPEKLDPLNQKRAELFRGYTSIRNKERAAREEHSTMLANQRNYRDMGMAGGADELNKKLGFASDQASMYGDIKKQHTDYFNEQLDRSVGEEVDKDVNSLTMDRQGLLVADPAKVREKAERFAAKYGLAKDQEFVKDVQNRMDSRVQAGVLKPRVDKLFDEEKKKIISEEGDKVWRGFTTDSVEYAHATETISDLQKQASAGAKADADAIYARTSAAAEAITEQWKSQEAETLKAADAVKAQFDAGKLDASTANQLLDRVNQKYQSGYAQYSGAVKAEQDAYITDLNKVNSRYNERFAEQQKAILKDANARVQEAAAKYLKEYEGSPEAEATRQKLNAAYEKAWKTAAQERGKAEGVAANVRYNLASSALGPIAAMGGRFMESTVAGLGGAFKGMATTVGSDGGYVLGQEMERAFLLPEARSKEFADLIDPANISQLSGQLVGVMAPSIVAAAGVSAATGGSGAPIVAQLVASSLAAWGAETLDISGRMKDDVFRDTRDMDKANDAAWKSFRSQVQLLPTYAFEGLPFVKGFLKAVPTRALRAGTGAAIEYGTEVLQEVPQNIAEKNIRAGKDPWEGFTEELDRQSKSGELRSTLIGMAPITLLGGAGQITESSGKQDMLNAAKSYAAKAKIDQISASGGQQWMNGMVKARGEKFARAVISSMYTGGSIDEATAKKFIGFVDENRAINSEAKALNIPGVHHDAYVAFSADYADLSAKAEAETSPLAKAVLTQRANEAKKAATEIAAGNGEYVTVKYPDGTTTVLAPSQAAKLFADEEFLSTAAITSFGNNGLTFTANGKEAMTMLGDFQERSMERLEEIKQGKREFLADAKADREAKAPKAAPVTTAAPSLPASPSINITPPPTTTGGATAPTATASEPTAKKEQKPTASKALEAVGLTEIPEAAPTSVEEGVGAVTPEAAIEKMSATLADKNAGLRVEEGSATGVTYAETKDGPAAGYKQPVFVTNKGQVAERLQEVADRMKGSSAEEISVAQNAWVDAATAEEQHHIDQQSDGTMDGAEEKWNALPRKVRQATELLYDRNAFDDGSAKKTPRELWAEYDRMRRQVEAGSLMTEEALYGSSDPIANRLRQHFEPTTNEDQLAPKAPAAAQAEDTGAAPGVPLEQPTAAEPVANSIDRHETRNKQYIVERGEDGQVRVTQAPGYKPRPLPPMPDADAPSAVIRQWKREKNKVDDAERQARRTALIEYEKEYGVDTGRGHKTPIQKWNESVADVNRRMNKMSDQNKDPRLYALSFLLNGGKINFAAAKKELGSNARTDLDKLKKNGILVDDPNAKSVQGVADALAESMAEQLGTDVGTAAELRTALIDALGHNSRSGVLKAMTDILDKMPKVKDVASGDAISAMTPEDWDDVNAVEEARSAFIEYVQKTGGDVDLANAWFDDEVGKNQRSSFDHETPERQQQLIETAEQALSQLPPDGTEAETGTPDAAPGEVDAGADVGGVGEAPGRQSDEEEQRLAAEAKRARAERDRFVADWNERGQGLFAPEEGMAQQTIDGGFDNSQENFDARVEPLNERVRQADKALADYVNSAASRAQAAAQQTSITEHGSPKKRSFGRIPVSPIVGTVRDRSDVLKDLSKGIERRIAFAKPGRKGMAGTYAPGSAGVKIKYAGDLDTTAHEIGHALDDVFGLTTEVMNNLAALGEAGGLSAFGSKPPKGHKDPQKYLAAEGVAEYIRARVVNPEQAKQDYPAITALYDKLLSKEAKDAIGKFSDDVRAFAGATGADMVMSNVDFDPSKSKSAVLKDLFKGGKGATMSFADRVNANWVNPLTAFSKAIRYAKDIQNIPELNPAKDPYLLARLLLHNGGKTSEVLESGMINSRNEVIKDANSNPKTLNWLLAPLDNTTEETVRQDVKDVIAYTIAERTTELGGRFKREDILTGIGAGLFSDMDVAQRVLDEMAKDPAKLARIQEGARRYREMATHTLEYLRDKGRMSAEQFNEIKKNNLQYVALQRVMEAGPNEPVEVFKGSSGKLASVGKPVKSIYGSSRKILNPYVALIDSINKSIKEADRNEVLKTFTDLLRSDREMHDGEPVPLSDVGVIGSQWDKNSITVFNNGKPEHWNFAPDVHTALNGLDDEGYKLPAIVRMPASVLRWTVTHFPVFAARNIARDLQSRLILSTEGSGFKDLRGDHEHWNEVARAGGLNAGFYVKDDAHYYGLLNEAMSDIAKNKKFILADPTRLKHVWHAYENALYNSETVNRVAEYRAAFRKAKEKGMDDYNAQLYAAFRSSDLIDFALAGHHARVMNQVVPFSNAMIQGLRSAVVSAKRDPAGFMARTALYGILPSAIVWMLAHQDDDDKEEYESLPAYQRDMFYNIKVGDNKWLVIPKPFELGLPGAAVDRMLSAATGKKDAFDGYAGSVLKSFLPDESAIAGPGKIATELMTNYDFFKEKAIVPSYENNLKLSLRDTEAASRAGKVLQKTIGWGDSRMDARKWDHFIQSQFSYFGKTALKLSDIGRDDSRNKFDLSDLGFFKGSPAYNSAVSMDVQKAASEYGLTSSSEYKAFKSASEAYFDAKGDKAKDAAAKSLRETAENVLLQIRARGEAKMAGDLNGRQQPQERQQPQQRPQPPRR